MYLRFLFLIGCAMHAITLQAPDRTLIKNLQSRYIRTIRSTDTDAAKTVAQSFTVLSQYHKQFKVKELLTSPFIENLFEVSIRRSVDQHVCDTVRSAQYLMLLQLYKTTLHQYIECAECFLNDLISAKKYWFYEDFYMAQSPLRRHPVYSFYSSAYKKNVQYKVVVLDELEDQVAHMLGMCLYGTQKIDSIESEDQIIEKLKEAIAPLYAMYHTPLPVDEIQHDPALLFKDLLWVYETMDENMGHVKSVLQENTKPSFVVEHWFGLSCAAATVLTGYIVYKQHEQSIPKLQEKAVATAKYIWNDYVAVPVHDLVDVLWYNQGKRIHHIPRVPRIEEQSLPQVPRIEEQSLPRVPRIDHQSYSVTTWLADSSVNKLVRPFWNDLANWMEASGDAAVNKSVREFWDKFATWIEASGDIALNNIVRSFWNDLAAWFEKSADIYVDQTNDLVMKNQQINLALAAIGPVLFVAYLGGKYTKAGYNRFIKHDNWYAPMKYSLRAADQLINSVARSNKHSFADDGRLYMLIMNVKQYISCLDNEELILMRADLADLLSFKLTYEQKHGVIERMYRTYQFLK